MKTMNFFSACIVASAVTCTTPLPRRDSMIYLLIISFTFLRGCAVFTTARKTLPKGCLLEIAHSLPRHSFFSYIFRMRYIARWALMRNTRTENVEEHSYEAAVLAHALAVIGRDVFHKELDPDGIAAAALFHDAPEIITGDMPTPVKYHNPALKDAYRGVEAAAQDKLLSMLPPELVPAYEPLVRESDAEIRRYVKAADKLSAYIKCAEELKAGNAEFKKAAEQTLAALRAMEMEELEWFMEKFLPAFSLTLDELQ